METEGKRLRPTEPWPISHLFLKRFVPWRKEGTSGPYSRGTDLGKAKEQVWEANCVPMPHPVQSAQELLARQSLIIETDRDRIFRNESDISHSLGDGQCQVTLTSAVSLPVWTLSQGYLKVGRDHAPHCSCPEELISVHVCL